jgi:hypothetical protein
MKRTLIALCVCCACISFSSCDEDDVVGLLPDFDVTLKEAENIDVKIDQTDGEWVSFSSNAPISIVNSDTKDHLNKIKSVKLTKLSYKIINFAGDENGQVEVSFSADNQVSLSNAFTVKTAADNGTVYEIQEVAELNRIAIALKAGNTIMVKYEGKALCDNGPMDFVVEVQYEATITVDP